MFEINHLVRLFMILYLCRYNRAEIIRNLRWKIGPVLPQEIHEKLSYSEEEYFKNHSTALESYMSELELDLTVVSHFSLLYVLYSLIRANKYGYIAVQFFNLGTWMVVLNIFCMKRRVDCGFDLKEFPLIFLIKALKTIYIYIYIYIYMYIYEKENP